MEKVEKILLGVILTIVTIIVVFQLVGASATDLTNAGANMTSSGLPLASLFGGTGVVMLIFMAGILIAIVSIALKMHKGG